MEGGGLSYFILLDITIAFILDLIIGDPHWFPHPIRFIGWLIKSSENAIRFCINKISKNNQKIKISLEIIGGLILVTFVLVVVFLMIYSILNFAMRSNFIFFRVINIYFIYTTFAAKCLAHESKLIYNGLKKNDIIDARHKVGMIVGRETKDLNESEITRAVVETVAENSVDGEISPIFYAVIGGVFGVAAPFAMVFKAINTMDSMVGYMNEKYIYFGRVAAKLDDVVNYIPARLSGVIIPISAWVTGLNFKKSFKIMVRDRRNHKSPNCAYSEAAYAGALGIQLGGDNVYFGRIVKKPKLGEPEKEIDKDDICKAIKIMYFSSVLTLIFMAGIFFILKYTLM